MDKNNNKGVTLIELMIAIAIIGLVAAIAAPLMTEYVSTSREGVLRNNIQSIRLFQDDYRVRNRAFAEGTYTPGDAANQGLRAILGWAPASGEDVVTYVVECNSPTADAGDPNCLRSSGYTVTATHESYPSAPVCMAFSSDGSLAGDCP